MRSPTGYKGANGILAITMITLLIGVSFAGAIVACYACFSTPSISTGLYTLQLDVSQINLSLVFPPYSGYSTTQNVLANYSFENSGLSPVYRIGLFGYCGGEIIDGDFKKDHCLKNDAAYQLNPWSILMKEINTDRTMRAADMEESFVVLPDSMPSKQTMRRKSLDLYGGAMAGMGLALWCAFSSLTVLIRILFATFSKGDTYLTIMTIVLSNFILCVFWAFGSFVSLAAGAGGSQSTYKDVASSFNNESDKYGIIAEAGVSFFGLIYGAMAFEIAFVVLLIAEFFYFRLWVQRKEKQHQLAIRDLRSRFIQLKIQKCNRARRPTSQINRTPVPDRLLLLMPTLNQRISHHQRTRSHRDTYCSAYSVWIVHDAI